MYLSRVEMTGFKSFADKTVIEFDQGMTAVVGPNGSGKSNLTEAIRWVLGEQSAKSLRGNRMEDVIFNGTQNRKPVNIAKVNVVLNNEDRYLDYDFSEISLSRSYNRNGDSHYFINNESVRLKDIVDLLLDSGLGKNSFSIISQGQVEQIFLNKPEERRTIFEEAAGVQKYQYRKTEAERKLNKATDNLSRVKDIIHELELQLKPLKDQKEKAIQYLENKETLKELEISLYSQQIKILKDEWQEATIDLEKVEANITEFTEKDVDLSSQINKIKTEQDELIVLIDTLSDEYQKEIQALEQLKAQQLITEKEIDYQKNAQTDKENSFAEQFQTKTALNNRLKQELEKVTEFNQQLKELKVELTALQQQIELAQGLDETQYDELRSNLLEWYQQEARANNQIQQSKSMIERHTLKKNKTKEQILTINNQKNKTEKALKEKESTLEEFAHQQQKKRQTLEQLLAHTEQLENQRQTLQSNLFSIERQHQTAETKVNSLRQMQANYSGYYSGVRAIMKQSQQIAGIEGTVADSIKVNETFQVAIDTALGASMQHIIVSNDQAARNAINYLKKQRAGRATFLPRPNIKARYIPNNILFNLQDHAGFIGLASDLVTYEEENRAIILNLLGNTIVAQSLEAAQAIAKLIQYRFKIVTLDGEVLMPGGALTGGQQQNQAQSMLARRNNLQQAEQEYATTKQKMATLEAEWQTIVSKAQQSQQELSEHRETMNHSDATYQQLVIKVQDEQQIVKQFNNQLIIAEDDLRQINEEINEQTNLQIQAEKELNQAQKTINDTNQMLEKYNVDEDQRKQMLAELETKRQNQNTQIAVLEVELKQTNHNISSTKENIEKVQRWFEQYEESKQLGNASLKELEDRYASILSEIKAIEDHNATIRANIDKYRLNRQELKEILRQQEDTLKNLQTDIQKAYHKQSRLEAQIEKNTSLLDNLLNHLNEEYQLSFEKAQEIAKPLEDSSASKAAVKKLRHKIEKLGPVNIQAIDDYELLVTRYDYLNNQQTDLLTAMNQLQQTMDEMDNEVIQRFGKTFKEINHQFNKTFKRLFGGGDAVLSLTNPKDLLTTGVDIIAQPPGKKKQNLALLSGGERALTAIALLFAILEVKPVPFVILDEVEAALDDANVYRYGEYIKDFTEETQFIVITHRKGTMESADRLYGVTMERSGVSKLASVRLSEAEETLNE